MTLRSWQDAGATLRLYTSTAGDWVSVGDRIEYPFEAGGSGTPAGWTATAYDGGGGAAPPLTDVNYTTSAGRFSISNASTTDPRNAKRYGIYRDFPLAVDERYIIEVQARIMDGKDGTGMNRYIEYAHNGTSPIRGDYGSQQFMDTSWTDSAIGVLFGVTGTTYVRIYLYMDNYKYQFQDEAVINWGGQWQNFALIRQYRTYPAPTWREVTCDTKAIAVRYGRDKFVSRNDVATASVTVANDDGDFTYSTAPKFNLRPGRFFRITASYPNNSTQYPFFFGVIDSITDSYTIDGKATAVINCVDPSSLLANKQLATMWNYNTIIRSGSRFAVIVTNSGWHPQMYSYNPGLFDQQAILASGSSVRDELGLIADSEGGYFWCDRTGYLVFKQRDYKPAPWTSATAELLAIPWGGEPLPAVDTVPDLQVGIPIVPLQSLTPNWSRDRVVNEVSISNKGGSSSKKVDGASQKEYGPRTYQRLDFVNDNANLAQTLTRIDDIMNGYTDAILRIDSVSFTLLNDPKAYLFAITAWLNDLVRVRYQHPTNYWAYAICTHIQSVTHTVTPGRWEVVLGLDQPVSYTEWIAGDAGWDIAHWDLNLWDEFPANEGGYWDSDEIWDDGSADPNAVEVWQD
jgi:hypothetical protein